MNAEQRQETNVAIARRLGWRVQSWLVQYYHERDTRWFLTQPNGEDHSHPVHGMWFGWGSEAEAWADIPDYCSSLDATVAALPPDIHLYIHYEADSSFTVTLREKNSSRFWCRATPAPKPPHSPCAPCWMRQRRYADGRP